MNVPSRPDPGEAEWRLWTGVQVLLSAALTAAFLQALWVLINSSDGLPLEGWRRPLAWVLVCGGTVVFAARTLLLLLRILGPRVRP